MSGNEAGRDRGDDRGIEKKLWGAAAGIVAVGLLIEVLPIIYNTEAPATWILSFVYVTFRFILLPFAAIVLLLSAVCRGLQLVSKGEFRRAVLAGSSSAPAIWYIVMLYLFPTPLLIP